MVSYVLNQLNRAQKLYPDRVAFKVNGNQITYTELVSSAQKNADYLCRQGTSPVVIIGNKSVDVFVTIISCLYAGRTYVPVEFNVPVNRIEKIINAVGATLIVSEKKYEFCGCECVELNKLTRYAGKPIKENSNETAYVIFTSGSTGEPKGVPISYSNLDNFSGWIGELEPLNSYKNAAVLNHASFSFDLSVADIYYSLCNFHTLIAMTNDVKSDLALSIELIKQEKINVMVMTPTSAKMYLLDRSFNSKELPQLKCIYFCGEMLEAKTALKLLSRFPDLKIINAYGPTEATSAVSATLIDIQKAEREEYLPVGDADKFATIIEIIDNEIVLKGNSVFDGYIGLDSPKCFSENGINCFRTGDCGFIREGKLYCRGRKDRQIKYMGYRIEPEDIENNISRIDGVDSCAVIASVNADSVVRKLTAFVAASNECVDDIYIRKSLRELLPEYMIPKTIKILKELPVNQNGKIDRKALSLL